MSDSMISDVWAHGDKARDLRCQRGKASASVDQDVDLLYHLVGQSVNKEAVQALADLRLHHEHCLHHAAVLEKELSDSQDALAAARAEHAQAQFELIKLQHQDVQWRDRCHQLEIAARSAEEMLQELSDVEHAIAAASDGEAGDGKPEGKMSASQHRQCLELRLELQRAQLDSLCTARDGLIMQGSLSDSGRPANGHQNDMEAQVKLEALLRYTQDVEQLLDTWLQSGRAPNTRKSSKFHEPPEVSTPAKSPIDEGDAVDATSRAKEVVSLGEHCRLQKTSVGSLCSTSAGGSSLPSGSAISSFGQDPEDGNWSCPAGFLITTSAAVQVQPSPKVKTVQDKKAERRVRFRPELRMLRHSREDSPLRRRRRSSTKFFQSNFAEPRSEDSRWAMPDFADWYGALLGTADESSALPETEPDAPRRPGGRASREAYCGGFPR